MNLYNISTEESRKTDKWSRETKIRENQQSKRKIDTFSVVKEFQELKTVGALQDEKKNNRYFYKSYLNKKSRFDLIIMRSWIMFARYLHNKKFELNLTMS